MSIHRGGRGLVSRWPKAPLPAWTPADLGAKLLGQIDAEDFASLTLTGAEVDAWADTVAAASYTAALTVRPTYSATSFGGRPGVTFDGTNDVLTVASVPYPAGADPCEIWAAVSQDATEADTAGRTFFGYGNTTATSRLIGRRMLGAVPPVTANTTTGTGATPAVDAPGTFLGIHVVRGEYGATASNCSMDGVSGTLTPAVPTTATTRSTIGARPQATPAAFWLGVINCIFITDPLTDAEALQLLAYLGRRCVP